MRWDRIVCLCGTALVCHGQINGVIAENNVVQKFMLDNPYM